MSKRSYKCLWYAPCAESLPDLTRSQHVAVLEAFGLQECAADGCGRVIGRGGSTGVCRPCYERARNKSRYAGSAPRREKERSVKADEKMRTASAYACSSCESEFKSAESPMDVVCERCGSIRVYRT